MKETDSYTISYNRETGKFLIDIFGGSSAAIRSQAENDLLDILGISQSDACKLDVKVFAAGQESAGNLSFCAK